MIKSRFGQIFGSPLAASFPELYLCVRDQKAKVGDYMERVGDQVVWGPIFKINLNEMEES